MPKLLPNTIACIERAILAQRLPADFFEAVKEFYVPVATELMLRLANKSPICVGMQGAQGSGKSTAASFIKLILETEFGLRVFSMSLDDFYLTQGERELLAQEVHPLFRTRGVPGTHDVELMQQVLDAVMSEQGFHCPVFDKAIDDRLPKEQWVEIAAPIDIVLFEGWCVGLEPQRDDELERAINDLERIEDADCVWREYVNRALQRDYAALFKRLDAQVVLQAPSFECVYAWRGLQEQKMIDKLQQAGKDTSLAQTPAQIEHFVCHFQRLTEHSLASMPSKADWLLMLSADHSISRMASR